jgi:hypothetical protein
MKTIPIHPQDQAEAEWSYSETERRLERAKLSLPKQIQNPGNSLDVGLERAALALILDRPQAELWATLRDILALGLALFKAGGAGLGEQVPIRYRGIQLHLQGGLHEYVDGPHWLWTWAAARLLRDRRAMAELCTFDAEKLHRGRTPTVYVSLIQAIAARELGRPWEALHDRALAKARALRPPLPLPLAWLSLMDCLDRTGRSGMDPVAYSLGLENALLAHRDTYGRAELAHLTHSRIDWISLAFGAIAHDEGLPLQCNSEYIPEWLMRGEATPSWSTLMAEPVPELAFEHNIGHPHAPDALYGNHRLFLWMDGTVRLEHRKGQQAKAWTARLSPEYFRRVLLLLREGAFPEIPVHTLPAGPSFRICSMLFGGRRVDALLPRSGEGQEPWKELFTVVDSIVVCLSGQRLNGYLGTLPIALSERVEFRPG